MRTLGDLRRRLSEDLQLPGDRMELWTDGDGGSGTGNGDGGGGGSVMEPVEPLGEKASSDGMSLGHYGLGHGGAVDVRFCPPSQEKEKADAVSAAAAAEAATAAAAIDSARSGNRDPVTATTTAAGDAAAAAAAGEDVVRVALKTNEMVLRGEDGVVRSGVSVCCSCCRCGRHRGGARLAVHLDMILSRQATSRDWLLVRAPDGLSFYVLSQNSWLGMILCRLVVRPPGTIFGLETNLVTHRFLFSMPCIS